MSADVVNLPPRRGTEVPKAEAFPLVLVAMQAVRLLRLAECDMERAPPKFRKAAALLVQEAADNLEKAIAAHGAEQAYSLGQQFVLAISKGDDMGGKHLDGARRTLQMLADALARAI